MQESDARYRGAALRARSRAPSAARQRRSSSYASSGEAARRIYSRDRPRPKRRLGVDRNSAAVGEKSETACGMPSVFGKNCLYTIRLSITCGAAWQPNFWRATAEWQRNLNRSTGGHEIRLQVSVHSLRLYTYIAIMAIERARGDE